MQRAPTRPGMSLVERAVAIDLLDAANPCLAQALPTLLTCDPTLRPLVAPSHHITLQI